MKSSNPEALQPRRRCLHCGGRISTMRRRDAKYCTDACCGAAAGKRWNERHLSDQYRDFWGYRVGRLVLKGIYELEDGRYLTRIKYVNARGHRAAAMAVVTSVDAAVAKRVELIRKHRGKIAPPAALGSGFVYFVEAIGTGRIKIGWTRRHPTRRMEAMQTGCPFPLRLLSFRPGMPEDERRLHAQFAASRVSPSIEWFYASEEILQASREAAT